MYQFLFLMWWIISKDGQLHKDPTPNCTTYVRRKSQLGFHTLNQNIAILRLTF